MLASICWACYFLGMAAKKTPKKPKLETFTTRLTPGTKQRLKVAAANHNVSVQALVNTGIMMALGDL